MSRIAVLGAGAMGSRMATNLLKQGHDVTVWNRSKQKLEPLEALGAIAAETPLTAVEDAEFVISMVRDDEASQQVWLAEKTGAIEGIGKHTIAIESSTLTVKWSRQLAAQFASRQLAFLDAPVAGSRLQAEAAQLIYLVGGETAILETARPILSVLGGAIHHAGEASNGTAIKLAINALLGIQTASIAELIGFVQSCGLDRDKAVEILSATPVCSPAAKILASAMVDRKFSPMFPIDLVEKDLGYLSATAAEQQVEVPIGQLARQVFQTAAAQGYGADNITGVAQLYW